MLDYLAETDLFRAYNLTLTFLGAGTASVKGAISSLGNMAMAEDTELKLQVLELYLLRGMSMLDYRAETDLFRAYNLTLTFLGAGIT